jgi:benzodiazapine receptor
MTSVHNDDSRVPSPGVRPPTLIALVTVTLAAGAVAGLGSAPGEWYAALSKPDWTPPRGVFGPVWTTLYLLMGIAAAMVWDKRRTAAGRTGFRLFGLQLVLNVLWSWLFFHSHRPDWALADLVVLWVTILGTIIAFHRIRPLAGWLLVPYLCWVGFAGFLNASIASRNPGGVPGPFESRTRGLAVADCAPWDGAATSIYLVPGRELTALPPEGPYLQLIVYQPGNALPGRRVDISRQEGNLSSGIAVRCGADRACASTNLGTITFEPTTTGADLLGSYRLSFNGDSMAGTFRAAWLPRVALCG